MVVPLASGGYCLLLIVAMYVQLARKNCPDNKMKQISDMFGAGKFYHLVIAVSVIASFLPRIYME